MYCIAPTIENILLSELTEVSLSDSLQLASVQVFSVKISKPVDYMALVNLNHVTKQNTAARKNAFGGPVFLQ